MASRAASEFLEIPGTVCHKGWQRILAHVGLNFTLEDVSRAYNRSLSAMYDSWLHLVSMTRGRVSTTHNAES